MNFMQKLLQVVSDRGKGKGEGGKVNNRPLAKLFCGMIRDLFKNAHPN